MRSRIDVLVLEDDASMVELLRHYLRGVPAVQPVVQVAQTLAEAREQLRRRPFDLAIVDLHLPDSSGIDTLCALAGVRETPFIVLTADPDARVEAAAFAHGAYDFLRKRDLDRATLHRLVRLASVHARSLRSLRAAEERFRRLTGLSSDVYWEQDAELRYTTVSGNGPEWLRRAQAAMIGKRRWELPFFNMTEADWAAHKAMLEARAPFRDLELGRLNDAGEEV